MSILDYIPFLRKDSTPTSGRKRPFFRRSFKAGSNGRLFADWMASTLSADDEIKGDLIAVRGRARDLANNSPYARKYLDLVGNNIAGPEGPKLQSKVRTRSGKALDQGANKIIEANWVDFCKPQNFSVCGTLSYAAMCRLMAITAARDGEAFCQIVRNAKKYKYGFAHKPIDPDQIDETFNDTLDNGNVVKMGIEQDVHGTPVAFHMKTVDSENLKVMPAKHDRIRVPAEDIIHLYVKRRPGQSRDVSWMAAGMPTLKQLQGYMDAVLVHERVAASKMGFYLTDDGEGYSGDDTDADGNVIKEAEPGLFEELPRNVVDFKTFDPSSPANTAETFVKTNLRAVASAWGVTYHSLANDLTDVNFSSIRSGTIEERDNWMVLQNWFIGIFPTRVFEEFLKHSLLIQGVTPDWMTAGEFDRFNAPTWQPKRWQWVDPKSDSTANETAVAGKWKTRSDVAAEQGKDFEEIVAQLAKEKELLRQHGLEDEEVKHAMEGNSNAAEE